jgi:hypothetical protein
MTVRQKIRDKVAQGADWTARQARGEQWVGARYPRVGLERSRPVRFDSMTDLAQFCRALEATSAIPQGNVTLRCSGIASVGDAFDEAADRIAHLSRAERRDIYVEYLWPNGSFRGVTVNFRTERGYPVVSSTDGPPDMVSSRVIMLIEGTCEQYTRRQLRTGLPLVEPLTAEDAARHAREREMTERAAKIGRWWGGAAGAILAAVISGLFQLFGR